MNGDISRASAIGLDAQFAELIEQVWACEQQWAVDDHIDACIKYSGPAAGLEGQQGR